MKVKWSTAEMPMENVDGKWLPAEKGEYSLEYLGDNKLFIIVNGKTFTAKCLAVDKITKQVDVLLNGQKYQLTIREPLDELLHSMGLDKVAGNTATNIKAPMPGLVLDVAVEPGSSVKKGDKVLVLEAMKMENIIKAGGDGIVARILVNKGETVDKNQVLIEFQ
jgi:biotin carboxyl carrier protein